MSSSPSSPSSPIRAGQLGRGKACLRCRRRKMRCDGARPTCDQCTRASIVDCEYTDHGPTTSQILEENISGLEARIHALQGNPAPIVLHDPHDAYRSHRREASMPQPGPKTSSQKIIQSFFGVAPTLGFFFDITHFVQRLQKPSDDPSSVSPVLLRTAELIGIHFSGDVALQHDAEQKLSSLLQGMARNLDDARKMDILQAEVLLAYYYLHTNRRTEGYYHIAGAVSIAVACNLYQIRNAAQDRRRMGSSHYLPLPSGDDDDDDCIRAFWAVFSLERSWSPWTTSPPAWPSEIANQEGTLTARFRNSSELPVSTILAEIRTEIPEQLLLLLRSNAAILFGEASYLADKRGANPGRLLTEFNALESRVNNFTRVVSSLNLQAQNPDCQRGLLLTQTLLYCTIIQLYARICRPWDEKYTAVLHAAVSAVSSVKRLDVAGFVCVDPVLGMLWGTIGQTLVASLKVLRNVPPTSSASVASVPTSTVKDSLNNLLDAMQVLKPTSPLIGHELAILQLAIEGSERSDPMRV